jgi:hypothetical protein
VLRRRPHACCDGDLRRVVAHLADAYSPHIALEPAIGAFAW